MMKNDLIYHLHLHHKKSALIFSYNVRFFLSIFSHCVDIGAVNIHNQSQYLTEIQWLHIYNYKNTQN